MQSVLVKAAGPGEATIIATVYKLNADGNYLYSFSDRCTVTVTGSTPNKKVVFDRANLSLKLGAIEQLALLNITTSDISHILWESSTTAVSLTNSITQTTYNEIVATALGKAVITATVYLGYDSRIVTCTVFVENNTIVIEEETPVGNDGTGTTELALEIPADVLFTGSFKVELPDGVTINESASQLAATLSNSLQLTITRDGNVWTFTITVSAVQQSKMRSAVPTTRIVDIVYDVAPSVTEDFELKITGLSFELQDEESTVIERDETIVPVTVSNTSTGIAKMQRSTSLPVGYYSISGQKLSQEPESGLYIILYDNGSAKMMLKTR
jgi:hypothetical protein